MAATKHVANFYSYKILPTVADRINANTAGRGSTATLEDQVRQHIEAGTRQFFQDRFQEALDEYTAAFTLIHRFVHPSMPVLPGRLIAEKLRAVGTLDALMAASVQVSRYRRVAPEMALVAAEVPPQALVAIVDEFGATPDDRQRPLAEQYHRQALGYLRIGDVAAADTFLELAQNVGEDDPDLRAHIVAARGAIAVQRGDRDAAESAFTKVRDQFVKLQMAADAASSSNNLGVLFSANGNDERAGASFAQAADHLPVSLARTVQQRLDGGAADTMSRPMGTDGLSMLLRDVTQPDTWVSVPSSAAAGPVAASHLDVLIGAHVVPVDLGVAASEDLRAKVYEPRLAATTVAELSTYLFVPGNFTAYLAHTRDFTLPMAIGDCHVELGEFDMALAWYEQARDYPFLNQLVEAPMVWLKMAKALLGWGDLLYQQQDKDGARAHYEQIVRLQAPELDLTSPLYASPVFDSMTAAVTAILATAAPVDPDVHNPAIAEVLLLAELDLTNLAAGIDFPLLSLAREQSPVFTFEYLQNVARYFADHAIQVERTYINFKTSAEQEEFQRSMLDNAVALEAANEQLEAKKVDIARQQKAAVDANRAYADLQAANAREFQQQYKTISLEQNALDAELTYVGAPTTTYDFSGYGGYGISDGEHRADEVLRTLTKRRQELSRKLELANIANHIEEMDAAARVAAAQQAIAATQVTAALMQQGIATLRRQQAEQQLEQFDSQEFTPELWNRLANEMKAISHTYLQQAIGVAQLMEQAYEFEIGEQVHVIKPDYTRNDLSGLLSGDFLLRDIDSFTFLRIVAGEKKQPMKLVLSLADRFPLQFQQGFQRTGRMEFNTDLHGFDFDYPGSYQQRIKRVEVVVEGLVGRGGIRGTLTNTGQCFTRVRDGRVRMRLLKPETLLLSSYRIGPDSVVFTMDGQTLGVFENSPVATSWILELRPSVNDLIYRFVTDVKLILYYESFYDADLRPAVLEELAESQPLAGRRAFALRYELFDEFFAFQDTGEVRFVLRDTMLPFYHRDPLVEDLAVLVETVDGVSPAALTLVVSAADGATATAVTDANGSIATGGTALDSLRTHPLLQEWVVSIPAAANEAAFGAGFTWSQVSNIVLVAEYAFRPVRIAGEPFILLRDEFRDNSLAAFEVIDDVQATTGGPSAWTFAAADERVEQHAAIFGQPGGPANGPDKPGTYLVRRTDGVLPAVQDFLLVTTVSSVATAAGIGLVFRWQDADNFYFFLMDGGLGYRRLGKKVGGVFMELATPAADLTHGYTADSPVRVRVRASGADLRVYLGGDLVLSGGDADLTAAGRVGFYTWQNGAAIFDGLQVVEL